LVVGKKDTLIGAPDLGIRAFICRTADNGIGWTRLKIDYKRWLHAVSFSDSNRATAVGDSGFILQSTNAGFSWDETSSGTVATLLSLSYATPSLGIIVGEKGTILRTTDAGITWSYRQSGTFNTLRGVWLADATTGVAVGDSMTILRTTDGGLNWRTESDGSFSALNAVTFSGLSRAYIVGEGGTILGPTPGIPVLVQEQSRSAVPAAFYLEQNYPNPFNPTTAISYQLPAPSGVEGSAVSHVVLRVYDVLGREVAMILNEAQPPGKHTIHWDASGFPSGSYFYRMNVSPLSGDLDNSSVQTRKLILLK
jgi:hypothetical protein